jgi:hypothetical protein
MTKQVVFNHRGIDSRELGAADLAKAGVEGFKKTTFHNGQAVEVEDNVADALVNHGIFGGDFSISEGDEPEAAVIATEANTEPPAQASGEGPSKSGKRSSTP